MIWPSEWKQVAFFFHLQSTWIDLHNQIEMIDEQVLSNTHNRSIWTVRVQQYELNFLFPLRNIYISIESADFSPNGI